MNILIFQHVAVEHPGSFREMMASNGHIMRPIQLDEGDTIPSLDEYDVLLVMGGPMDVWEEEKYPWLAAEKAAIREWVSAGRPYLGMCLGEQLLADALDGEVARMTSAPEVGISSISQVAPDRIFAGVPQPCICFQWHGAEVTALPQGARLLATSEGCAVQGFAIGPCAYGLQFHLELTDSTASEWGSLPEYAAALEAVKGVGALAQLQAEVSANLAALRPVAAQVFSNFLAIAEAVIAHRAAERTRVMS